jgi:ribosomal protein S18 acetylase RimI-like enzyme
MEIRPAAIDDAAGIARVLVDTWKETYQGILPDEVLQRLKYGVQQKRWAKILAQADGREGIFVAVREDGEIVGFASGGPNRDHHGKDEGELYAIYVQRDYQGQGLGRALWRRVAAWLAARNFHSLVVWVYEKNPARGFYEAQGGQYLGRQRSRAGPRLPEEVSYGWADLQALPRP